MTAREAALNVLERCERGGYSNLALDAELSRAGLGHADRGLCTELCYGTIERMLTLDHILDGFVKSGMAGQTTTVRCVLRMGAYQLLYLDRVPESAAVNESVALIKKRGHKGEGGFVNAVLRALARGRSAVKLPARADGEVRWLSVAHSVSPYVARLLLDAYGSAAERILNAQQRGGPLFLRVNTLKTTERELRVKLAQHGVHIIDEDKYSGIIALRDAGSVTALPGYDQGEFFVQNPASALCVSILGAHEGETVLDLCAAPGGKSFGAAIDMRGNGRVIARDLHDNRVRLIEQGARRLGLHCVEAARGDAAQLDVALAGAADAVLCDVPCSGLGVLSSKPDIRYKCEGDVAPLPPLQLRILSNAAEYVKPGGRLVYSTCTLNPAENERVVSEFLCENGGFIPEDISGFLTDGSTTWNSGPRITLLPTGDGVNGFYIARMKRVGL